jgi:hypothetical protein
MEQRKSRLSVAHRYGIDNADGTKEVIALVLIHIFRSKAIVFVLIAALAGLGFIPFEGFQEILLEQSVLGIGN